MTIKDVFVVRNINDLNTFLYLLQKML